MPTQSVFLPGSMVMCSEDQTDLATGSVLLTNEKCSVLQKHTDLYTNRVASTKLIVFPGNG